MRLNLNDTARKKTISLTPLIDVVFILLLFFMLTSTFLHMRQIDVSAATEAKQQKDLQKFSIIKLLNNQGDFSLNQQVYSMYSDERIQSVVAKNKKAIYVIEAKSGVKTQTMITLLDAFKQAGAVSVTLAGIN